MPARPDANAPFAEKLTWLRLTHAYCPAIDRVVKLYEPSDECTLLWTAFAREYKSWCEFSTGSRGGQHVAYATALWEALPDRLVIAGVRMRPDRDFPIYREGGQTFKNTFRRAEHSGSGDITEWTQFMAHLLPIAVEREWFLDWLAHKWCYPAIPGVAVVMVAVDAGGRPLYGAGRGILRDIIARLLGAKYVRPIDFNILTGTSSQATYTDWAAYSLLVTVNEAKEHVDAGRWSERRATYERLKELIDPRPTERTFQVKGLPAFRGLCFASFFVASNHSDALQIPPEDRRFAVLSNGKRMAAEMADKLAAWMEQEGNIAELARSLEQRDLTKFDPYLAFDTTAKVTMQELARDDLDEALAAIKDKLGPTALFTSEQIRLAVLIELEGTTLGGGELIRARIQRRLRAMARQVNGGKGDLRVSQTVHGGEQRARILCWRDYNGPVEVDAESAESAVKKSYQVLNGGDS
jgi:uncharacterized protein DUF5906